MFAALKRWFDNMRRRFFGRFSTAVVPPPSPPPPPPSPPPPPPSAYAPPELSGVPREGEAYWLSPGEEPGNLFRYKLYRDGSLFLNTTNADPIAGTWSASEVGKVITGTVEASVDAGANYGAPVPLIRVFLFDSEVITPAAIPDGTATRTSASGVPPMTFDVTAEVYDSYIWEIRVLDASNNETYQGFKGVAESELTSPFNVDLTGATDPAPSPPMPVLSAPDTVKIRLISGDYAEGVTGVAQNWLYVPVTNPAGHRYWKLTITNTVGGGNPVLREIQTAIAVSGTNNASAKAYTYAPSSCFIPSGSFGSARFFDDTSSTLGGLDSGTSGFPCSITIDYAVAVDNHELRLYDFIDFVANAPAAFTFAYSDDNVTFTTVVTASGLTWNGVSDETKTWSW